MYPREPVATHPVDAAGHRSNPPSESETVDADSADDNLGRRLSDGVADGFKEHCSLSLARGEAVEGDDHIVIR